MALLLGGTTLAAQDEFVLAYVPPSLGYARDNGDAREFYVFGEYDIRGNPHRADEMFRWAARLNPVWSLPLYGRALAQMRGWYADAVTAAMYGEHPEDPGRAQFHLFDSLMFAAITHDPFLDRRLDAVLVEHSGGRSHYQILLGRKKVELPEEVDNGEQEFLRHNYPAAIANWRKALVKLPELLPLYYRIAEAFYAQGRYDSAIVQLHVLAESLTKKEEKELIFEFQSKTMATYATGAAQVQLNDLAGARESYQRVLTEDLGFYMAHVRLAGIALLMGENATAITELGAAIELNETDPAILFQYGYVLYAAGRVDEAVVQFRKAIAIDPYFAEPYQFLGRVFEAQGKTREAIGAYQAFVDHASREDAELMSTIENIIRLSNSGAGRR